MLVAPGDILPSQDSLKLETINFILDCIEKDELIKLPPTPIVRKNDEGDLIVIDGHNLIAVMYLLDEMVEVHIAKSPRDGIKVITADDQARNKQLKEKFDSVLGHRRVVESRGIYNFEDLTRKYPELAPKRV